MRCWLVILALVGGVQGPGATPTCSGEDELTKRDFRERVEAMRERLSGFDQHARERELLEKDRRAGLEELKRRQWEFQLEQIKERYAYARERAARDAEAARERVLSYERFAEQRSRGDDQSKCDQQRYTVLRDNYLRELEKARTISEEKELGILPKGRVKNSKH